MNIHIHIYSVHEQQEATNLAWKEGTVNDHPQEEEDTQTTKGEGYYCSYVDTATGKVYEGGDGFHVSQSVDLPLHATAARSEQIISDEGQT